MKRLSTIPLGDGGENSLGRQWGFVKGRWFVLHQVMYINGVYAQWWNDSTIRK